MKARTKERLYHHYSGYWLVKLGLHKKYSVDIKKDNRLDCRAQTVQDTYTEYTISFNTKHLISENEIIHTVLHEIGHLMHHWGGKNKKEHEYFAEYFALCQAKIHYPKLYNYMVRRTINDIKVDDKKSDHRLGYIKALEELEINWKKAEKK